MACKTQKTHAFGSDIWSDLQRAQKPHRLTSATGAGTLQIGHTLVAALFARSSKSASIDCSASSSLAFTCTKHMRNIYNTWPASMNQKLHTVSSYNSMHTHTLSPCTADISHSGIQNRVIATFHATFKQTSSPLLLLWRHSSVLDCCTTLHPLGS